jgi:hypothetical protein
MCSNNMSTIYVFPINLYDYGKLKCFQKLQSEDYYSNL